MAKHISLPPEARRGTRMATGKGWRIVTPNKRRAFKAALRTTLKTSGPNSQRLAIFRIN